MAVQNPIRSQELPPTARILMRAELDEVHRGGRTMNGRNLSPPPLAARLTAMQMEPGVTYTAKTNTLGIPEAALGNAPPRIPGLPTDSKARKEFPTCTGVIDYFTAAIAEVAHVSWCGNQKHNPGEPLHHARGKSMDHPDCIVRHTMERGGWDKFEWTDAAGVVQTRWVMHSAYVAWRALADLQQECEDLGAPRARAAR